MLGLAEIVEQLGMRALTVSEIVARAGISRRTFYEHFADRDEALVAAVEEGLARAAACVVPAYRGQAGWREAMRAGLAGLLRFLDEEPAFGSLLIFEAHGRPLEDSRGRSSRRSYAVAALLDAIDAGRELARAPAGLSRATAEGVLGGVLFILQARMHERRDRAMSELSGELMDVIVRPYLGSAAAEREARRPPLMSSTSGREDRDGARLVKADVRLTMRTVLVLRRIADHPGSSNHQLAALADIRDQGQASKLLARLKRAGLIENAGPPSRGGSNAWRLTVEGMRLTRMLSSGARGRI
jgi:AcrR family transcriptional regulator/DNA-binding MarR family transcriptional regulator